jgi:transposase-like protein
MVGMRYRNWHDAIEAYRQGQRIADIARRFGAHPSTVHVWIDRYEAETGEKIRGQFLTTRQGNAIAAYREGHEIVYIARQFGVLPSTITAWIKRYEARTGDKIRRERLARMEAAANAYRNGESMKSIAERHGVDKSTVSHWIADYETQTGDKVERRASRRVPLDTQSIVDAYRNGARMAALAAQYGVSTYVIRRRVQEYEARTGDKLRRHDLDGPPPRYLLNLRAIVDAHRSGLTMQQIGEQFGVQLLLISRRIRAYEAKTGDRVRRHQGGGRVGVPRNWVPDFSPEDRAILSRLAAEDRLDPGDMPVFLL